MRGNFKTNILLPFLKFLKPFKANVFAIDIANEIDWCWAKKGGISSIGPIPDWAREPKIGISLPRSSMVSFVKDIYKFIKTNSPFACTVSFAKYSEMTKKNDFDFVDFFDYHRYLIPGAPSTNDNGTLPNWGFPQKCIIGEAGHKYPPRTGFNEALQASSSRALMDQALAQGYSGVLLWRYTPVDKDLYRLLKLTTSGATTSTLNTFITNFIKAARTAGSPNPFTSFERTVWNEVPGFVKKIKNKGKMP
jgi:hypothetical protein